MKTIVLLLLVLVWLGFGQYGPPPGWDAPPFPMIHQNDNTVKFPERTKTEIYGDMFVFYNGTKHNTTKGQEEFLVTTLEITRKISHFSKPSDTSYTSEILCKGRNITPAETDSIIVNGIVGKPTRDKKNWLFVKPRHRYNVWHTHLLITDTTLPLPEPKTKTANKKIIDPKTKKIVETKKSTVVVEDVNVFF